MAVRAYQHGYHGVLGIDSLIAKSGLIFPVVELNARFNLSTYVLA